MAMDKGLLRRDAKVRIMRLLSDSDDGLGFRSDFRHLFEPYHGSPYPVCKMGSISRVTQKYLDNWVNLFSLTRSLSSDHRLGRIFQKMGLGRWGPAEMCEARGLVKDVISYIGTQTYAHEWDSVAAALHVQGKIEDATGITKDANNMLAYTLEDKISRAYAEGGPVYILDAGPGVGYTSLPLLKLILDVGGRAGKRADYLARTRLHLVDVSSYALGLTYSYLVQSIPEFRDGIVDHKDVLNGIKANFSDLAGDPAVSRMEGSVDIIVSGAAICHQSDLSPFFRACYHLLRHDGVAHVWDWHNGPSFAAPRLRLSPDNSRRTCFSVTYGNEVRRFELPDEDVLSPYRHTDLIQLLEKVYRPQDVKVVFEMTRDDSDVVFANFRTLLSFLGYSYGEGGGLSYLKVPEVVGNIQCDEYLMREFHERIRVNGPGFSFVDDFLAKMSGVSPLEPSPYYLIEGYGDDYAERMLDAGFAHAENYSFSDVYGRFRRVSSRSHTTRIHNLQIRYTFARKENPESDSCIFRV